MIPAITKLYLEEVQRPLLSEIISGDYTVRAGGIVDVDGSVWIRRSKFKEIPYRFGIVSGDFNCSSCENLLSLKGSPERVGKDFNCSCCNRLTSLQYSPREVGGEFSCSCCNGITTLQGVSEKIGGGFNCSYCLEIITLEGSPKEVGEYFNCSSCLELISLQGAPEKLGGSLSCHNCPKLTSLRGAGYLDINKIIYDPELITRASDMETKITTSVRDLF